MHTAQAASTLVGMAALAVILASWRRIRSRSLAFFACFYALGLIHHAGALVLPLLVRGEPEIGAHTLWLAGLALGRARFAFLVLFTHSLHRFRAASAATAPLILLVCAGMAFPFFAYSAIPELMEMIIVLYCFGYWLRAYAARERLPLSDHALGLLKAILFCSGFFLLSILLDALESIPEASVHVSILLIDFGPIYMASVGVLVAARASRLARGVGEPAARLGLDAAGLSAREREVAESMLRGKTNRAIAAGLFIAESTVKKHVNSIFRKLGVASRWELLKRAKPILPK
jgi:DNA-binding CsgD family transcriptional regulator